MKKSKIRNAEICRRERKVVSVEFGNSARHVLFFLHRLSLTVGSTLPFGFFDLPVEDRNLVRCANGRIFLNNKSGKIAFAAFTFVWGNF
jgi:hypothetical protein